MSAHRFETKVRRGPRRYWLDLGRQESRRIFVLDKPGQRSDVDYQYLVGEVCLLFGH